MITETALVAMLKSSRLPIKESEIHTLLAGSGVSVSLKKACLEALDRLRRRFVAPTGLGH